MKKLLILMTVLIMTLAMVGCSTDTSGEMGDVSASDGGQEGDMQRPEGLEDMSEEEIEAMKEERGMSGDSEMMPPGMATTEASTIPVTVTSIAHEAMKESMITNGTVMPYGEVTLGSDSGETIETLMVDVGDQVLEGDILYTFDMDETELSSKSQLINASQNIDSAKLSLENAQIDYDDTLQMYEKDYATEAELLSAEQALKSVELMYSQAVTDYNTIKEQTDYDLGNSVYYAPVSGTIAEMAAVEDQRSTTSDFTIIDMNYFLIETVVSGEKIKDLSVDDQVTVTYGETILAGTIDEVSIVGINDTDSYYVYILVPNEGDILRFGFSVDVQFTVEELENQVVLPKKAILTDAYGDYVYVVVDRTASKVTVEQGLTQDGYVQVFGDLTDGDQVIIDGQNLVSDGGAVSLPGDELEAPGDLPEGGTAPEGNPEMSGEEPPEGEEGESRPERPSE